MLSAEQRQSFHDDGFLILRGALDADRARDMDERIWRAMHRFGIERDDPLTWPVGPANNLQRVRRGDSPPLDNTAIRETLHQLMTAESWRLGAHWGTPLVTFRNVDRWDVPHRVWHLDYPYSWPIGEVRGMNIFVFVNSVAPTGGGTLVIRSSPRLVQRFVERQDHVDLPMKAMRGKFDRSHPWLRSLSDPADRDDRIERYMAHDTDVDGVDARVVELTGEPGDIVFCHPWLVHSGAPNALDVPRMMRVLRAFGA